MPDSIQHYAPWDLVRVTPVSHHSAIYSLTTKDRKRGTPNPRGGGRSPPTPKTWHTTLLAWIGTNDEGPLPYIERDYTPVSTAKEWEQGKVDILIKIYETGRATQWIMTRPSRIWLSQPIPTLTVPTLVHDSGGFSPASILLVLAGTGVVVLPQILHHRDPIRKIGVPSRRRDQLHVPVDVILSCRRNDVLELEELGDWCREGAQNPNKGLRRCLLLVTPSSTGTTEAFPDGPDTNLASLEVLPNITIEYTRLQASHVNTAVSRMPPRCRVVVSGPSSFNAAARSLLLEAAVPNDSITILEA